MLMYVESSIWQSPAQTLVNTVNTVGVMGKGIALQFKQQFPDMYKRYREICENGQLHVGTLWLYKGMDRNVLNFPTKTDWRRPSKVEYIVAGLEKFLRVYEAFNISSISFPQLGTGHGGLSWSNEVQPLMEKYLKNIPIPVYVHLVKKDQSFLPEYLLPIVEAIPFDQLLEDIQSLAGRAFQTIKTGTEYRFEGIIGEDLVFVGANGVVKIQIEELRMFWGDLSSKRIIKARNGVGQLHKTYSYLVPVLGGIDYIKIVNVSDDYVSLRTNPATGLMLATEKGSLVRSRQYEMSLL